MCQQLERKQHERPELGNQGWQAVRVSLPSSFCCYCCPHTELGDNLSASSADQSCSQTCTSPGSVTPSK